MKVAVLSDIHGNMQALNSVMQDININNCEQVFCLGDFAMAGPQRAKVIDLVKSQDNWVVIQGPTEKMIAEYNLDMVADVRKNFPVMASALANDVKIISNDRKEYLKSLEPQKNLTINGVKVLLVHGSPRRNNEDILPDMPLEQVEEMLKDTDADLIFCGHTHIPAGYQTNTKQTVVNVGSVGRPMTEEPRASYVIADIQNGAFSIEHKFIDYNVEAAAKNMVARDFLGSAKIAEMILHPGERHI